MVEKLSNKKFMELLERKVRQTIRKYKLLDRKDKVGVAVSGGKDSTVVLYLLKKFGYDVEGLTIDAKIGTYTEKNLENLKKVCEEYDIPLHVVSFREEFGMSLCYMRSVLKEKGHDFKSCMLCGILKRYLLNKYAKRLGFDKLVTGHNLDDESEAFMMNVFRNDARRALNQGPIAGVGVSKKFVPRVKPLYFILKADVKRYSKIMKFPVHYGKCPCSLDAYRREYRTMLDEFEKKHPCVKHNIVRFHEKMILPQRERAGKADIKSCSLCGEPSAGNICKTCEIFTLLFEEKKKGKDNKGKVLNCAGEK